MSIIGLNRNETFMTTCIDATGSLYKGTHISISPYKPKHIFLYGAGLKKNTSIPLTLMISATQKIDKIYLWLKTQIAIRKLN